MNRTHLMIIVWLTALACTPKESRDLTIHFIDVEGGAATLIVTSAGESVLMDAGWGTEDDRDAVRIVAAMNDAGITKLDYVIASHYHNDHVRGMPALARRVQIGQYVDHGESVEQNDAWKDYLTVAEGKRRSVTPGDTLPLSGVDFTFVTSNGEVLDHALANAVSNIYCQADSSDIDDSQLTGENPRSVGYLLSMGNFQFLNLGDLTVNIQHKLACPSNKIGVIDLYQVPHHGNGVSPELSLALAPTVAVLNNGGQKGGDATGYEVISAVPGIQAIWQVHRALKNDDQHNSSEQLTANLTEENDEGHGIKAIVQADGSSYTIENGRNGYSENYVTK